MTDRIQAAPAPASDRAEAPSTPAPAYEAPRILAKRSVARVTLLSDTAGEGGGIGGE